MADQIEKWSSSYTIWRSQRVRLGANIKYECNRIRCLAVSLASLTDLVVTADSVDKTQKNAHIHQKKKQ